MPVVKKYAPGTPSYVDLGVADVGAAAEFYSGLFGWQVVDLGEEAGGYRMAVLDGHAVAGLGPATDPGPPRWTQYVTVDDAAETAEKAAAAGGNVVLPPMRVLTAGTMCLFIDPTGAACAAWQPGASVGAELVNAPGPSAGVS